MSVASKCVAVCLALAWCRVMLYAVQNAYKIRLHAIETYGYVIHEFDPWFNFRATKYLAQHGWHDFFHWFDYMSWYPLGRPVGTTIYPGMQITSVVLWKAINAILGKMTLNDVCCMVPAWFGVSATLALSLLTLECSRSWCSAAFAACIMAIVPAHLMRSVGGGYDNESVAITAMCLTFLVWCRALRGKVEDDWTVVRRDAYVFGVLSGLCYVYMASVWGGFVFVLNLVVAHAFVLAALFRYTEKLRVAYSLFFLIGTMGATTVPVVGMRPLKDTEQLPAVVAFVGLNLLGFFLRRRTKANEKNKSTSSLIMSAILARIEALLCLVAVCLVAAFALYPRGYFGPISARVRGLFVKHTRTGNPLVDSVAEHQPASTAAYEQYLHHAYRLAPAGLLLSLLYRPTDARLFLWTYACVAVYFCSKMARLIILLGPAASALGGIALGVPVDYLFVTALRDLFNKKKTTPPPSPPPPKKNAPKKKPQRPPWRLRLAAFVASAWTARATAVARLCAAAYLTNVFVPKALEFRDYAYELSEGLSQPSIMFKARLMNGEEVMVDDYREAYLWLKKKTKKNSRILAWWDYGYQITGIGERTTLADGNTWNHEHIATLGRILTAPEEEAWEIARHLADYVLVWAGGGGDDLAKSPHMARIGNSVYHDFCPDDPTCAHFGFYPGGRPSQSMAKSLLYKLTQSGLQPGVELDTTRWKLVYSTRFGKVRIFKINGVSKESRAWIAANRVCDAEGSWYCPGQYPPAIKWLIDKRKPFRQLEDFNTEADESAKKYNEEYHKRMDGHFDDAPLNVRPVGCYRLESQLPDDKDYGGGRLATSIHSAAGFARSQNRKMFAISRVYADGHVFAFDGQPEGPMIDDEGCRRPCPDKEQFFCGCADAGCPALDRQADEDYLRRWMVYAIVSPGEKSASTTPKKKRTKKRPKAAAPAGKKEGEL